MGVLLAKFWPHLLAALLLAALSAVSWRALSLEKTNAVLSSQMQAESDCRAPSHCRQAVTALERDTAKAAVQTLVAAAEKVGTATVRLDQRTAEIERQAITQRARLSEKIREAEAKLAEAASHDAACKKWLDDPVPCPVPGAGVVFFHEDERHGLIDRSGAPAKAGVPAATGVTDDPAVHGPPDAERPQG
jgi:hypothetical protein